MIGSLTARIFAIFWLTLALVQVGFDVTQLYSRQITELLDSEQRQGLMISSMLKRSWRTIRPTI